MRTVAPVLLSAMLAAPVVAAQQPAPAGEVTFTKDIAPILQSKCQRCHRPDSTGPMPLISYEEARPWAKAIKARTSRGTKSGVMPPWHVEKGIGIAAYKDDLSLSPEQIAKFALWADADAPRGNPADMPLPRHFDNRREWTFEPDLVLTSPEVTVNASNQGTWATIGDVPTGLTESRYVAAVQIREINDVPQAGEGAAAVKGPFVIHHVDYGTVAPGQDNIVAFPRYMMPGKAETFDPADGHLMPAGSILVFDSAHVRANGKDTRARLEFAFKFHPKNYTPTGRQLRGTIVGGSLETRLGAPGQMHAFTVLQENTKIVTFDPHLPNGVTRLCLEAITGTARATLTCAEFTGVGPQSFAYEDDAAPLLPKGTILHLTAFLNPSKEARPVAVPTLRTRVADSKLSNTFLSGGLTIPLSDEEFEREMAKRRGQHISDLQLGCPLCNSTPEREIPVANR